MGIGTFQFLLVSILAAAGFFVGIAQSWISPEEMKDGKKYFKVMKYAMLVLLILYMAYVKSTAGIIISIIILLTVYFGLAYFDYLLAGATLGLQSDPITAIIIFLYGFPCGSLLFKKKNKYVITGISMALLIVSANIVYLLI